MINQPALVVGDFFFFDVGSLPPFMQIFFWRFELTEAHLPAPIFSTVRHLIFFFPTMVEIPGPRSCCKRSEEETVVVSTKA